MPPELPKGEYGLKKKGWADEAAPSTQQGCNPIHTQFQHKHPYNYPSQQPELDLSQITS